jgi:hypothetical protein
VHDAVIALHTVDADEFLHWSSSWDVMIKGVV